MNDLHYAIRHLLKQPGFTAVAVLTLALGIGATTAIYSVVNTVILDPVPGANAGRLVTIHEFDTEKQWEKGVSAVLFHDLRALTNAFEAVTAVKVTFGVTAKGDFVQHMRGFEVAPDFFQVLGVKPGLGRVFSEGDAMEADGRAIVLSHAWWREEFGGDPGVIGRSLQWEDGQASFTVVGVMPPSFQYPNRGELGRFWVAGKVEPGTGPSDPRVYANWRVVARLQSDVSPEQARTAIATMADGLTRRFPSVYNHWTLRLEPLREQFSSEEVRRIYLGLLTAVVCVLLIACANVANLLLVRAESRRQEMSVRLALGATRTRLVRMVLTECILLSLLAGGLGLLVAVWGIDLMQAFLEPSLPMMRKMRMDGAVFGLSASLALLAGIGFGLAPAWRSCRQPMSDTLKSAARGAMTARRHWLAGSLVVVEIALALVVLIGAGLMLVSVSNVLRVDPGFDYRDVVKVGMETGLADIKRENISATFLQMAERFQALPDVESAGFVTSMVGSDFVAEDGNSPAFLAELYCSTGSFDYFRVLKAPLLAGRLFDTPDLARRQKTIIVNESLAKLFWPGVNPIGKRLREASSAADPGGAGWYEVIGVVGDIRDSGFESHSSPLFYQPAERGHSSYVAMMVRYEGNLETLASALRAEMAAVTKGFSAPKIESMADLLRDSSKSRRTCMHLLAGFALAGLALALIGIYGVTAHSVVLRTREIGIRMALGAQRKDVLTMVVSQGALLTAIGLALGWLTAIWVTRVMAGLLYDVSATDPAVFSVLGLLLALVALVACYLPARRAACINPMEALRHE